MTFPPKSIFVSVRSFISKSRSKDVRVLVNDVTEELLVNINWNYEM